MLTINCTEYRVPGLLYEVTNRSPKHAQRADASPTGRIGEKDQWLSSAFRV